MALHNRSESNVDRVREQYYSPGHQPPVYKDKVIPTLEARIYADGGPGKLHPGAQGTNPWILGSMTIGSNKVWNIDLVELETSTPNVWYKLRHSHSGSASPTSSAPGNHPGGTLASWHLAARGALNRQGDAMNPIRSIRQGTVFVYGFGAGSVAGTTSNRVHRAIGIAATDRFSGLVKGHIQ